MPAADRTNRDLRAAVDAYLATSPQPARGGWRLQAKGALVFAGWAALVTAATMAGPVPGLWLAAASGVAAYAVGTCVLHECSHLTFARRPWVNRVVSYAASVPLGMSPKIWYLEHILRHHPHTNVQDADPDLERNPTLRFAPHHPWRPIYRWQHVYMWLLYPFVVLARMWVREVRKLVHNPYGLDRTQRALLFAELLAIRLVHVGVLLVAPAVAWDSLPLGVASYLAAMLSLGLVFSFAFQMGHVQDRCRFPVDRADQAADWAVRQLETTVNWGIERPLVTWMSGGLNFQVVHHIFPSVHHLHHPEIHRILVTFCAERGLPLHDFDGVTPALLAHVRTIRAFGQPPPRCTLPVQPVSGRQRS